MPYDRARTTPFDVSAAQLDAFTGPSTSTSSWRSLTCDGAAFWLSRRVVLRALCSRRRREKDKKKSSRREAGTSTGRSLACWYVWVIGEHIPGLTARQVPRHAIFGGLRATSR